MEVTKPKIAAHLFWEYDLGSFDFNASRNIVIERGNLGDWRGKISKTLCEILKKAVRIVRYQAKTIVKKINSQKIP